LASASARGTSVAASQFRITPSAADAASRSMPGRRAASSTAGGVAGGRSSLKRRTRKVSNSRSTTSPASAARRNSSMSRLRANGLVKSAAFQSPTTTGDDAPMPSWNRPGAASASAAAVIASRAGPRVKTGVMAVPSRACGCQAAASVSGVKASVPATSDDQRSVKPASARAANTAACSASGTPPSGTVIPHRVGMSRSCPVIEVRSTTVTSIDDRHEQLFELTSQFEK
jgi:hypothetical protein